MKTLYSFLFFSLLLTTNIHAQQWAVTDKLIADDKESDDNYGYAVDIDGAYAIVGAYHEDDSGSVSLSNAGAAYILSYDSMSKDWTQVAKLHPSDRQINHQFGNAVAIYGSYAVVGAAQDSASKGAVYVYEKVGSSWNLVKKLEAPSRQSSDRFGTSVDIYKDTIVVGAPHEDENAAGSDTKLNAGSAYIFVRSSGVWTFSQKIVASDRDIHDEFGTSVSVYADRLIVGAYRHDGDTALQEKGAAYVFAFAPGSGMWVEQKILKASDRKDGDRFGWSVSTGLGNYYIVGAPYQDLDSASGNSKLNTGAAYIYHENMSWAQVKITQRSDDRYDQDNFGHSVAINNEFAVIGAPYQNYGVYDESPLVSRSDAGAVYIVKRLISGTWPAHTQKMVVQTSDRFAGDKFGHSVALDKGVKKIAVGAVEDNFDGSPPAPSVGAVYIIGDTTKPVSVTTSINNSSVSVFPNPVVDVMNVDMGKVVQNVKARLVDISGRVIYVAEKKNVQQLAIDMKQYTPGMYMLEVETDSGPPVKVKIVKY